MSHRAVAERAGLPLAATTYYFASLEDLSAQAMTALAERWLSSCQQAFDALPARFDDAAQCAAAVLQLVGVPAGGEEQAGLLVMYERYLEAARHPALQGVVTDFDSRLQALLGDLLHRGGLTGNPAQARLVLAVADGALLRALAEGADPRSALGPLEDLLTQLATTGRA